MLPVVRKLAVRSALSGVAVAALAVVALGWRLSRGPLEIPFVTPRIEEAFSRIGDDVAAHVGRAELIWSPRHRPEIRVVSVRLFHSDGTLLAIFPELSVWPSLRAAIHGQFAVARVGLAGPRLSLIRSEDGQLIIGTGTATMGEGASDVLAGLLAKRAGGGPSHLWRIDVHDADLTLEDRRGKTEWRAETSYVGIRLREGGLTAEVTANVTLQSATDRLVGGLAIPLTASADIILGSTAGVESISFDVLGKQGRIFPVADPDPPIAIHSLFANGSYSGSTASVEIQRLQAVVGSTQLDMSAHTTIGARGVVEARGTIDSLPVLDLTRLWPPGRAGKTRTWIAHNVREGGASNARFVLRIPYPDVPGEPLPDDSVEVDFDVDGLSIDYLKPMDPLRQVRGTAKLTAKTFVASIDHGVARTLSLRNGRLDIDIRAKPAYAKIAADVAGATADILTLIDEPPLHLTRKLGISTSGVGGNGEVRTELALPLASGIDDDDVHVVADAKLTAARIPDLIAGVGVENGDLRVRVNGRRFEVEGNAGVTGVSAVSGPVRIALAVEPRGDPSLPTRLRGAIDGSDVGAEGEVALDAKGLHSAALTTVRYGLTNLSADITRDEADGYSVRLEGATLDLEPLLRRTRGDSEPSERVRVAWALDGNVARLLTGKGLDLIEVRAQGNGRGEDVRALRATGSIADGGAIELEVTTNDEGRVLTFATDQGGKVIKALGLHDDIVGGQLTVAATIRDDESSASSEGRIEMSDFRVIDAPLLAKVLNLGSLDGLATMLGREGIGFARARVPISWSKDKIELRDARAVGSIGVTADGTIDRTGNQLDIRGQVIPAYTLNSALGKVPLIGKLLVGGEGKGVFGIAYRVQGTTPEPKVSVNPISVLAPGVLRQLFVDPFTQSK
jgi:hypothetical protein